ncbi:hypothetical protein N7467_008578 [Penicillium canescens]|nr:hypothetical protein N7467_008578 [Penicillium canescens]
MEFVNSNPTSFEDSVSNRIVNIGTRAIWGILEFSLGILLSDDEMKQIKHIVDVADRIFANTNDYFSWEVERDNGNRVQNSIKVLMETEGRSEEQAKEKLKNAILKDEKNYQHLSKQFFQSSPNAPPHVQRFIAMLEVLLGGHHIWCAACERYKVRTISDGKGIDICTIEEKSDNMAPQYSSCSTLDDSALLDPVHYIQSLPSKNMRSKVIDALNIWFRLPDDNLDTVKSVIDDIHNSTLILDDIQDASFLRRGFATAHQVFGPGQCINSATYMVARAASRLATHQVQHPQLVQIFLHGLKELAVGQSWDLNWKVTGHCPSTAEYLAMVDGKTGAMFELIIQMMQDFSSIPNWPISELNQLAKLLGRWYQIRDDYQNLQDEQYTSQKGFCEDLDEGKLSYPLTVCCGLDPMAQRVIMGIFRQRQSGTPLALNVKTQILDIFRHTGALQQTWEDLENLERKGGAALSNLEAITGEPNPKFRAILSLLGDIPRPT